MKGKSSVSIQGSSDGRVGRLVIGGFLIKFAAPESSQGALRQDTEPCIAPDGCADAV